MDILFTIKKQYLYLRKSEKKVADYILNNFSTIDSISLSQISSKTKVSQTTVIRFVHALGFDSFKEFKVNVIQDTVISNKQRNKSIYGLPISKTTDITNIPYRMINNSIESLQDVLQSINIREFDKAINSIVTANNIGVFGVENSKVIMQDLVTKLLYLGKNCLLFEDYYLQSIAASNLKKGDIAIAISYSGMSQGTIEAIKIAKNSGATAIVITNFADSNLVEYADILLCTSTKQFLYGDCIFSRITQMTIIDILYVGILLSDFDKFTKNMDEKSNLITGKIFNKQL